MDAVRSEVLELQTTISPDLVTEIEIPLVHSGRRQVVINCERSEVATRGPQYGGRCSTPRIGKRVRGRFAKSIVGDYDGGRVGIVRARKGECVQVVCVVVDAASSSNNRLVG